MSNKDNDDKREAFTEALKGVEVPVLTLDNKWYRLLDEMGRESLSALSSELNEALKRQGKLNTESKRIKSLKKQLMNDIVELVDAGNEDRKVDENKRLIEECNEKLEQYQDELMELPRKINEINRELMVKTALYCYDEMQENTADIEVIEAWVKEVRIELKKKLIRKQEMEQRNFQMYSYMHDIFGKDITDLFDLKYDPSTQYPQKEKSDETNKQE